MKLRDYMKILDTHDSILYTLYTCSSILFLSLLIPFHPYPFSFVLKSIPMLSLSIIVIKNIRSIQGILFSMGILFCMGGDITLDIDRTRLFIPGLIFFLIGHLFYIAVFLISCKFTITGFLYALPVITISIVLGILFSSIPIAQRIPVLIYLAVISAMTVFAAFTNFKTGLVYWGAVLFMISDIIIAINKFYYPIPNSTLYNIGIYFVAQFLLATALVSSLKPEIPQSASAHLSQFDRNATPSTEIRFK
ncbi:MAG TPA: lysoplasmalogenase [Chitinispirillaceae bacterium]|nr:lysoplasmalogenase [Chitinispirillaceae bacterium]